MIALAYIKNLYSQYDPMTRISRVLWQHLLWGNPLGIDWIFIRRCYIIFLLPHWILDKANNIYSSRASLHLHARSAHLRSQRKTNIQGYDNDGSVSSLRTVREELSRSCQEFELLNKRQSVNNINEDDHASMPWMSSLTGIQDFFLQG